MLVAADLPGHRLERSEGGSVLVPDDGGPVIGVSERVERRFLGRTEVARFHVSAPAPDGGSGRISVRHSGRLRRQGVEVQVLAGDEPERRLVSDLASDDAFRAAALPLDFTRFEVGRADARWTATVELMGASYVSIALPPMRSYVRLHPDQAAALVGSLRALSTVLDRHHGQVPG